MRALAEAKREIRSLGAAGDAALVGDRDEELEVDEVEAHGRILLSLRQERRLSP